MSPIKVFARSRASTVAGAIAGIIREHQRAEVLALGDAAVNRALRAVDLAIVVCKQDGIDVHCMMESADETIRLIVEAQDSLDRSVN
jgi:stage V sporulation protein S